MEKSFDLPLAIEGMHCGGCVNRVTAALRKLDGVAIKDVSIGSALVTIEPEKTSQDQVLAAINKIGFTARAAA